MTPGGATVEETVLAFDEVSVHYPGAARAALHRVSFTVPAGQRVALVGPSGAGKSTVLALAAGLTLPTTGRVSVLGTPSEQLGRRANRSQRSRIGIITQDLSLIGPLRVATNVAAGRLGRRSWIQAVAGLLRPSPVDEIGAVLDVVGIADKIWERTDQLSGGEQQRTAIARALFQQPDLLLADEPVSALDPARSEAVMEVLTSGGRPGGQTLVTSLHDAPLALRHCDRIVALRQGRVHFDRPAHAVTARDLQALYDLTVETVETGQADADPGR